MPLNDDRSKVAHLLRRFALGASEAEVEFYSKDGLDGAIELLLNEERIQDDFAFPIEAMFRDERPPNMVGVQIWWIVNILTTRKPLREKLAVFWHDHFATSASKVTLPPLMYQQVQTLRTSAISSFETLLVDMSKDPAMLFWLDNQFNVAGKPNENFARELMELFTLGIGHYSEQDVQEASRCFTGWSYRRGPRPSGKEMPPAEFLFRSRSHDEGSKSVLGKSGPFGGEDVIAMLCEHPQTALTIVTKMWEWFAYAKPEPRLVERIASDFQKSGLEIKSLVRSIMESPEFYSAKAERSIYKNPLDFTIPTLRQLGVGERVRDAITSSGTIAGVRSAVQCIQQAMMGMGMVLLYPPDVAGWETGPGWISSATMVERIAWGDRLFGPPSEDSRRSRLGYPAEALFVGDRSPEAVARKLVSVFDCPFPEEKIPLLVEAARKAGGEKITDSTAGPAAVAVSRLLFGSPEFQFA